MLCCSSFWENNNKKEMLNCPQKVRFAFSKCGVLLFPLLASVSDDCKSFINNFQNIVPSMTPYLRPVVVKMTL